MLPNDEQIRAAILQLLQQRQAGVTACPSEVARSLSPDGWRDLMPIVRAAARRLAEAGVIEVTRARTNAVRGGQLARADPLASAPLAV